MESSERGCPLHHPTVPLSWSWSLVVAVAIAGLVAWLWRYREAQRRIPGPTGWPVIGCTITMVWNWDRLHDWFLEMFSNDARTVRIEFAYPHARGVYTVDPANVEYILKTNFANYPKGDSNCAPLRELLGCGIFTTDGEMWKEQRRVASYEFSSATLRDFSTVVFRDYASKLASLLARFASAGEPFDLQDLCMRMTLDSTSQIGFGVKLNCLSPSLCSVPFAACFDDANYISFYRHVDPLWQLKRRLNVGRERKLKDCVKALDDFTFDVIEQRRKEMMGAVTTLTARRSDLLSRFIDLCKREGEGNSNSKSKSQSLFTDKALRDMILNFIIAGRDTTAITLSWFFYVMARRPEIAHKIVDELTTVVGDTVDVPPTEEIAIAEFAKLLTYETLGQLHYLHATLSETLRLYPAVPLDGKEAMSDDVLPNGTVVRKGNIVGYVPYSMGRMTFIWGEDAAEFKPERWLRGDGRFQPQPLFKFTAFQAGPRTCLGKDSAYLQMKMTAALVLRFFALHLVPGHPIAYRTMLVLTLQHGLQVTATPRSRSQHPANGQISI